MSQLRLTGERSFCCQTKPEGLRQNVRLRFARCDKVSAEGGESEGEREREYRVIPPKATGS